MHPMRTWDTRNDQINQKAKEPETSRKVIAVIVSKSGAASQRAARGDWSAFVCDTREEAIRKALDARRAFETNGSGPYRILVGELQTEVVAPQSYVEVAI